MAFKNIQIDNVDITQYPTPAVDTVKQQPGLLHRFKVMIGFASKQPIPQPSPPPADAPPPEISLGDLHGNTLKLLWFLVHHGVLELTPDDYQALTNIYNDGVDVTTADFNHFTKIIDNAKVNTDKRVRLIGDDLADRGKCDFYTLWIIKRLRAEGLPLTIMLSNHSLEAIHAFEHDIDPFANTQSNINPKDNRLSLGLSEEFALSFFNLQRFIDKGLTTRAEVLEIYKTVYKPTLKLIDYSLTAEGIAIYSHAPIGLANIKNTANKLGVPYDDSSVETLAKTIDAVNEKFQQTYVKDNEHELYTAQSLHEETLSDPIPFLLWNRETDNLDRPEQHHGYKLHFVHGHDTPSLKLIDYSQTAEGIAIYSHAPIGLANIENVAEKLGVDYADNNIEKLIGTIKAINAKFHKDYVKTKKYNQLYASPPRSEEELNDPISFLLWNKKTTNLDCPTLHNGYKLHFAHVPHPVHITNLDGTLGKNDNLNKGQYTAFEVTDCMSLSSVQQPAPPPEPVPVVSTPQSEAVAPLSLLAVTDKWYQSLEEVNRSEEPRNNHDGSKTYVTPQTTVTATATSVSFEMPAAIAEDTAKLEAINTLVIGFIDHFKTQLEEYVHTGRAAPKLKVFGDATYLRKQMIPFGNTTLSLGAYLEYLCLEKHLIKAADCKYYQRTAAPLIAATASQQLLAPPRTATSCASEARMDSQLSDLPAFTPPISTCV